MKLLDPVVSSRRFAGAACLAVLAVLAATSCSSPSTEAADLVLRGGKVATVDASNPSAQAVAVRGSRIVAVGGNDEISELIGANTRVVELDGRLLIPGFIEGHGHFTSLGDAKMILDLTQADSWDDIVAMVGEVAGQAEPGEWIRGRGWHQEKWTDPPNPAVEGNPVHTALSAVSPDNPVLLGHASGHAAFANAKAMELAGIDRDTENPPGGELAHDQRGEPTGLLRETAQGLVGRAMSKDQQGRTDQDREAEMRRKVELAGAEALSKGVTSFHDAGASFATIDFFQKLEAEGELPVRLYVMVRGASNDEMAERLASYRMVAEDDDFLTVRSIKRQIDGALGAHGAWLLEPYADMPESIGLVLEPEEDIRRTAEIAIDNGFQVNTHAIGDRANRRVLDIYQEVFEASEASEDLRWRIEHAQHLHPDEVPRFAELGIIASMQGIHCTSDAPWVFRRLGPERAESGAYLWRDLIDAGVVVTNGTDVPVEDIDPIQSYYASVARLTANGDAFFPDQAMSREEALRSYTLNNAYAAFEEDIKGSIEVGKLADLVVLSKDILTVPVEEILESRVDLTLVGGETLFQREDT